MKDQIFHAIKNIQFNYQQIIDNKTRHYYINNKNHYDVNVIIPLYKRQKHLYKVIEAFQKAIEKQQTKKINITISELVDSEEDNLNFCIKNNLDYICVEVKNKIKFPKSLLMNLAALHGCDSQWFLFHDVDCLPQSDFFINLFENINKKNSIAIQTFQAKRVLYLNDEITKDIFEDKIKIDDLNINNQKISLPGSFAAPGGSVMVRKKTFFDVGGYDDQLFTGYAPEDFYFWEKVLFTEGRFDSCDDPKNELYHLHHELSYGKENKQDQGRINDAISITFIKMSPKEKKEFISHQKDRINKDLIIRDIK